MSDYEELKEPRVITPGWEYVCFTDQPFRSKIWDIRRITSNQSAVVSARNIKINYYTEFETSIYIDGSFAINCDLNVFWQKNYESPFTVFKHPIRDCVYEECQACIRNRRASELDIAQHMDYLHREGVPAGRGMIQSGILLRSTGAGVAEFCQIWYDQIRRSTRDQIGFVYADFKMPGIAKRSRGHFDYRTSQEFIFHPHYNRRNARRRYT